jgi:hypothetical protein
MTVLFVVSIHGVMPKDGLSVFAGAGAVWVKVGVYDAAVVGVAAEDQGVSPRMPLAKIAPFESVNAPGLAPPVTQLPVWKVVEVHVAPPAPKVITPPVPPQAGNPVGGVEAAEEMNPYAK